MPNERILKCVAGNLHSMQESTILKTLRPSQLRSFGWAVFCWGFVLSVCLYPFDDIPTWTRFSLLGIFGFMGILNSLPLISSIGDLQFSKEGLRFKGIIPSSEISWDRFSAFSVIGSVRWGAKAVLCQVKNDGSSRADKDVILYNNYGMQSEELAELLEYFRKEYSSSKTVE